MLQQLFQIFFGGKAKPFAELPGPTPKFPLGTLGDFRGKNPWEVCARYGEQYGGCTLIWLGPKPALVLNDAELIHQVLDADRDNYYKKDPRSALLPVITKDALFLSNGKRWETLRSHHPFCQHFFADWLSNQVAAIQTTVERHLDSIHATTNDLVPPLKRMAFDAFAQSTLGTSLGDDLYSKWVEMGNVGSKRMTSLLSFLPPFSPKFHRSHKDWYASIQQIIDNRVESPTPSASDLLSTVIKTGFDVSGKDGPGLIDFTNVYMGGCFSASSVLITALYLLDQHPAALVRLEKELSEQLTGDVWTAKQLVDCHWLNAVLHESMRFISPVPLYFRNSNPKRSIPLGEVELPPDTMLFITNRFLHRDPSHWPVPDEFQPDRWLSGGEHRDEIGSAYFFPFGRGPRMCVGWEFAMLYMQTALATIINRSNLRVVPGQSYQQELYFGVMLPKKLKGTVVSDDASTSD